MKQNAIYFVALLVLVTAYGATAHANTVAVPKCVVDAQARLETAQKHLSGNPEHYRDAWHVEQVFRHLRVARECFAEQYPSAAGLISIAIGFLEEYGEQPAYRDSIIANARDAVITAENAFYAELRCSSWKLEACANVEGTETEPPHEVAPPEEVSGPREVPPPAETSDTEEIPGPQEIPPN